jgi:hypothetical protein
MSSSLSTLNSLFEAGDSDPPPSIWNEWLWDCDLAEPVTVDCLLNRMHLLGLLIARLRAVREPHLMDVCVSLPQMVHQSTRVVQLTPRQLKDVVEDLQMHWMRYQDEHTDADALAELVDALMARFGSFCLRPYTYDDVNMRDAADADRMSVLTVRRIVTIFCVLYRHLHMMVCANAVKEDEIKGVEYPQLEDYHVQASQEAFFKLAMHADIPPAAHLLYQQDFAGFYHCVSQVVYFHYPSYERRVQLSLERVRSGDEPVHTLAPLMELYPEIHLCYEDGKWQSGSWNWVLMGKRVYLVGPELERVWWAPSLMTLLGVFLAHRTLVAAAKLTSSGASGQDQTPRPSGQTPRR